MGASIHMHIELKSGDTWHHYSAPHIFRNTVFFDLVSGMYERIKPVTSPRGLPQDITFVTKFCYDQDRSGYHLHHEGWLGADEIVKLQRCMIQEYESRGLDRMDADLDDNFFHTYINGNSVIQHQGWDDVRFIFWFDG